jgi:hypothetical protein
MKLGFSRIILALFLIPAALAAQNAILTGTVTDASGKPSAGAVVSAEGPAGNQAASAQTGADGAYTLTLPPGTYTLSVSTPAGSAQSSVMLAAGDHLLRNLTLTRQPLPSAPAAAPKANQEPSLSDLGFSPQQMQANPQLQARLDKRTEMLKIHQRLGLITAAPMAAALITGPMAKAKGRNGQTITEPTQANLDFHAALGGITAALYFSTAYFAVFAPKIPDNPKKGAIRMHEALAFIHGPGMIVTPILGAMAFKQEQDGERVHGAASYHGAAATVTAIAYGASIVAVSWPIHVKFWEKK